MHMAIITAMATGPEKGRLVTMMPPMALIRNWKQPRRAEALPALAPCGDMASTVVLGKMKPKVPRKTKSVARLPDPTPVSEDDGQEDGGGRDRNGECPAENFAGVDAMGKIAVDLRHHDQTESIGAEEQAKALRRNVVCLDEQARRAADVSEEGGARETDGQGVHDKNAVREESSVEMQRSGEGMSLTAFRWQRFGKQAQAPRGRANRS